MIEATKGTVSFMGNIILKTENISKKYGSTQVLNHVSITLENGRIYGLIGVNGAGKTTLMRQILGLSIPTSGEIELFGKRGKDIARERSRLGCLIESPGLVLNLTAKQNLHLHRIMHGIADADIEDKLLETVGLTNTGKKKAKDFSLGMKQRLGIAIALLTNPELVILDEPINGLDPIGVVEIRELIKKLCDERGMTILISSHNLPELYQCATDYIIIDKGQVKQEISLEELEEKCRHYLRIESPDKEKLVAVLENELGTTNFKVMPDGSVQLYDLTEERDKVSDVLFSNGVKTTGFSLMGETLENYFISVVGQK